MSHNSPESDPARKGFQDLHTLVQAARNLTSEDSENSEYNRALVELIADTTGLGSDEGRAIVERLVNGKTRDFEIRGRIVIDYAMGFSEAEAVEWFPDAQWDDPGASHAGNIETECLDSVRQDFWLCVQDKRDTVIDMDAKFDVKTQGNWKIRDEVTGVVEL